MCDEYIDSVISFLYYYIETIDLTEPMKQSEFAQRSYTKWAINEIIEDIDSDRDTPPAITIENFAKKMDDLACSSRQNGWIFSIAYDTAYFVLDMIMTYYRDYSEDLYAWKEKCYED